ncbi:MAG: hypothetical protein V1820_06355 [archaeon]
MIDGLAEDEYSRLPGEVLSCSFHNYCLDMGGCNSPQIPTRFYPYFPGDEPPGRFVHVVGAEDPLLSGEIAFSRKGNAERYQEVHVLEIPAVYETAPFLRVPELRGDLHEFYLYRVDMEKTGEAGLIGPGFVRAIAEGLVLAASGRGSPESRPSRPGPYLKFRRNFATP